MIKINKKYILYSILSFVFFGFGVSLQLKAAIGQSVLNALAVTLADILGRRVGTVLNVLNSIFFIAYLLFRRTRLNTTDAIQIAATIANGYIINFFLYNVLFIFTVETWFYRLLLYLLGLMIASVSLGAVLAIGIIRFPLESLCLTISETWKKKFTAIRLGFDGIFFIAAVSIALWAHAPMQIREGTLISFFLLSPLLGICYDFFKKRFNLEE